MGSPYTWPRQNDTGPTTNRAKYLCDGSIGAGRASFIVSTDGEVDGEVDAEVAREVGSEVDGEVDGAVDGEVDRWSPGGS